MIGLFANGPPPNTYVTPAPASGAPVVWSTSVESVWFAVWTITVDGQFAVIVDAISSAAVSSAVMPSWIT